MAPKTLRDSRPAAIPLSVAVILTILATPAFASSIVTNVAGGPGGIEEGCVGALPSAGAAWESTGHFQFAVFWDDNLTCEATTDNGYAPYYRYDDFDGTGGLRIEMFQAELRPCKKYQIDWRSVSADGSLGVVQAILINPVNNPECQGGGAGSAAVAPGTPVVPPGTGSFPGPPSFPQGPPAFPPGPSTLPPSPPMLPFAPPMLPAGPMPTGPVSVPEPGATGTLMLIASGALWIARRNHRRARASGRSVNWY